MKQKTRKLMMFALAAAVVCVAAVTAVHAWVEPGRFTDHGDGTVTDEVTRLMWQQTDDGIARTWQGAIDYCAGLDLAGRTDWRLPHVKELSSIVFEDRYSPAIDTDVFPGAGSSYYWSSSPFAYDSSYAWLVLFYNGHVYGSYKTNVYYARCVRP